MMLQAPYAVIFQGNQRQILAWTQKTADCPITPTFDGSSIYWLDWAYPARLGAASAIFCHGGNVAKPFFLKLNRALVSNNGLKLL
jgi:hypothetical protein